MLTIIFFIIISTSIYMLTLAMIKSINSQEPFFDYLYSALLFIAGIGVFTYFYLSFHINLQDFSFNLSMLWLLASLVSLIILIIFSIQKKAIIKPGLVSAISFAAFSIVITVYLTLVIF